MHVLPHMHAGLVSMVVPVYLAECAPAHLRGTFNVANIASAAGGVFASGIVAFAFSYVTQGWRYIFLSLFFCIIICK